MFDLAPQRIDTILRIGRSLFGIVGFEQLIGIRVCHSTFAFALVGFGTRVGDAHGCTRAATASGTYCRPKRRVRQQKAPAENKKSQYRWKGKDGPQKGDAGTVRKHVDTRTEHV
ncbi:hypothetical protein CE91St30_10540 [Raoultibacter timonensis]|uniref:Uncharacterized protein n=1 Tax=Raoultibacter timonensis TaxID=1907662 RepID=A0ABN6MCN9_9ACTN|nr:hypothetical protein CE91St30_10540 [Raoultibacter timonensis]BDF50325.1 hypothetical protein CE91St31_10550 [Raoultibacter timonensis]